MKIDSDNLNQCQNIAILLVDFPWQLTHNLYSMYSYFHTNLEMGMWLHKNTGALYNWWNKMTRINWNEWHWTFIHDGWYFLCETPFLIIRMRPIPFLIWKWIYLLQKWWSIVNYYYPFNYNGRYRIQFRSLI